MDYNDNDYEGHNLHLSGEESSKISSVLRPFALPKFEFDDNLHGHMRFDSLVENEVFLGIPNQEDNQWIEDYSRGGNEIEFSSSAAESCALPRHVNVWSEATSSESVEMLLKAVGQEEMVQGEKIEESVPGNQLTGSTEPMEGSIKQDDMIENINHHISSLLPTGVEENISRSNQSAGLEVAHTGYIHVHETMLSSYGVCVDKKDTNLVINTENLSADMEEISDEAGGTSDLVNESNHVQGSLHSPGAGINISESSSQNNDVSVREFGDQNKLGDIGFLSSSSKEEGISNSVKEQEEGFKENVEELKGVAVETDDRVSPFPCENPSKVEASKEDYAVEICATNLGEVSDVPGKENPLSTDVFKEVALLDEPVDNNQQGTTVISSCTETRHLHDVCNMLHEGSSASIEGEDDKGIAMNESDVPPSADAKTELKHSVFQPSDQDVSLGDNEESCLGSHSSLEAPHSTDESSVLHEALQNPPVLDGEKNPHASDLGSLSDSMVASKCCEEKSVTHDIDRDSSLSHKKIGVHADHIPSPSTVGSLQTHEENNTSMQLDALENDVDTHETKHNKSPLDPSGVVNDEKGAGLAISGEENAETTTGSQPNSSKEDYTVLDVEGKNVKSTSSSIKGNVDSLVHNSPSHDQGRVVQGEETEADVLKQQSSSISEQTLKSVEAVCAVEIEKQLDSAVETRMSVQHVSAVATSSVAVSHDSCTVLNKIDRVLSADDLMVQDTAAPAPAENPIEVEKETNQVSNSSTLQVVSCTAEIDRSNQAGGPGAGSSDLPQNEINTVASLERINPKHSGKVPKKSKTSGATVKSKEEGTFTFEIRTPAGLGTGSSPLGSQSFPRIQACNLVSVGEAPPSSAGNQTNAMIISDGSRVTSITADVSPPSRGSTERKSRRGSSKPGRASAKRGNQLKETTPLRAPEKGGKSSQLLSPLGAAGQLMTFESVLKPRGMSIPACTLPDLNTSTPSSAFFQQPFTDLQQVQLRAQIFVYGSLIQGVAPDEACMVSAFGTSDGIRSTWESSWRACVERLQSQKSQGNNSETPLPLRPGIKASDQTIRQSSHESEAVSSVTSRAATKVIPSPVNPMMPLSSPLWSMATPSSEPPPLTGITKSSSFDYPPVSPLNPSQMPPVRNYITHSSGPLQASFPVPWLASSLSSPFDISTSYPALTIMEPLKLTPVKETSLPVALGTKHISPIPVTLTAATTVFAGTPSLDSKKMKASSGQTTDTKSRKGKKTSGSDVLQIPATVSLVETQATPLVANPIPTKAPAVEGLHQISVIGRNQADLMPKPPVDGHYNTASVSVATPSNLISKSTTNQLFSAVPPSIIADRVNRGDLSIDKMTLNIEGFNKVKEAKSQAEEAASHATAAINHCEGMWSQLDRQKNSGLTSDTEYKLASAAVAIAAAASVAKAAAAAAKIASSAALEAKKMADEAIAKSGTLNVTDYNAVLASNATPFSILQGGSWNNTSSLVISAAKEAAKKRIEDAAAATRHAENLDAIVKAAELAAEAVSHTGKIVTMGHPFSLSELALAGPNNYWKGLQVADAPGSKPEDLNRNKSIYSNAGEASNLYVSNHSKANADLHVTSHIVSPIERVPPRNLEPDRVSVDDDLMASVKKGEKSSKPQKDKKASNESKITGSVSDPGAVASIKEGSFVEVLRNRGDSKAWFTATVLSMKDLEALVCYTELKSDEGSELLKEWISLEAKDGNAPKVRIPHPMTTAQSEGTRKRRRSAVKDYTWSAGDRVDAWIQDCWCEGIVAEKNSKDASAMSIQFPDMRETLTVKLWHLRPTLIWSDGQWTEWHRPGRDGTAQGDTPDEKRMKLGGGTSIETKGEGTMAKTLVFGETEKTENPRLPLSANEKAFNIGSTRAQDKPKTGRGKRSGSEKEASGVVFGRPDLDGKRMKFINVSKHYGSEGTNKANVPSDSTRLAKFMNPKGSGSWGTKNKSKADAKDKQVAVYKPRVPKSGKPPSIPSRSAPKKDGLTNSQLTEHDHTTSDHALGSDENESGDPNHNEFESFTNLEETSEASSQDIPPENTKKGTKRKARSERGNQGKPASTSDESAKEEAHESSISEVAERRRSHRRIQPTSRLLEGIQSSIVIPKFPSTSHDKGPRSHKKRPTPKE